MYGIYLPNLPSQSHGWYGNRSLVYSWHSWHSWLPWFTWAHAAPTASNQTSIIALSILWGHEIHFLFKSCSNFHWRSWISCILRKSTLDNFPEQIHNESQLFVVFCFGVVVKQRQALFARRMWSLSYHRQGSGWSWNTRGLGRWVVFLQNIVFIELKQDCWWERLGETVLFVNAMLILGHMYLYTWFDSLNNM